MADFREYSISSRILNKTKILLNKVNNSWGEFVSFKMSRDKAKRIRKKVIPINGKKIVDSKQKKIIEEYCKNTFGSRAYWPWLAYYTELRGEFKEGWTPYDYYRFKILPEMNPEQYMRFSEVKAIDHTLFNESIIEPLFIRSNGFYYDKDKIFKPKAEIEKMLDELDNEIIIKPEAGRAGTHIIFENSKELSLEKLPNNSNLIFHKVVKQHRVLNKLYPHSVNTFRVLTFIDNKGAI